MSVDQNQSENTTISTTLLEFSFPYTEGITKKKKTKKRTEILYMYIAVYMILNDYSELIYIMQTF